MLKSMDSFQQIVIAALFHNLWRFQYRAGKGRELDSSLFGPILRWIEDWSEKGVIPKASLLASGLSEEPAEPGGDEAYAPLVSVFSKVVLPETDGEVTGYPECWRYHKLAAMSEEPNRPESAVNVSTSDYEQLWEEFTRAFRKYAKEGEEFNVERCLLLLEKYTSFIPFAPSSNPEDQVSDVSLYDHAKLTAALASCIGDHDEKRGDRIPENIDPKDMRFLLVGGGISGIQDFVYTISSKGALKTLRGRSFFLELLTEHVVFNILKSFGLYRANVIFAGGGKFNILLPAFDGAEDPIETIRKETNDYLVSEHEARLYLVLESVPFTEADLDNFSTVRRNLEASIAEAKQKKFKEFLGDVDGINGLLAPRLPKGEECRVCHKDDELVRLPILDEEILVCSFCRNMFEWGRFLPDVKYIIRRKGDCGKGQGVLIGDACYSRIIEELPQEDALKNAEALWVVNEWELDKYCHHGKSFPLFVANYWKPKQNGEHYTFEDFGNKAQGIDRIGVLRMDADHLGRILTRGFEKAGMTFMRLHSFSRQLNIFFKLYLNGICGEELKVKTDVLSAALPKKSDRKAVIVYSGGDDLFIIGSWDDAIELAFDIHSEFSKFTAENPDIHLSGAVSVFPSKYPLHRMASLSKEGEDKAKDEGRKRISLFYPYRSQWEFPASFEWSRAQGEIVDEIRFIVQNFHKQGEGTLKLSLSRGFIQNVLYVIKQWDDNKQLYLPKLLSAIGNAHKSLKSRVGGAAWKAEVEGNWNRLKKKLMGTQTMATWRLVLTWLDMLVREKEQ